MITAQNPLKSTGRIALLLYLLTLTYLSLRPVSTGGDVPGFTPNLLIMHAAAYFVLAFLLAISFPGLNAANSMLILGAAFGYGLALELAQVPITGRYFTIPDLVMNGIGIGLYHIGRTRLGIQQKVAETVRRMA